EDGQVLVVVRFAALGGEHRRHAGNPGQGLVVEAGDTAPDGDELVEPGQLGQTDGGVQFAHPPGVPEPDVVAAEEPGLALVPVDAGLVPESLIGRGDDAALAAGDDLGGVEGKGAGVADRAG